MRLAPRCCGSIETRSTNRDLRDPRRNTGHAKRLKDLAVRGPIGSSPGRNEHCGARDGDPMDPVRGLAARQPPTRRPVGPMPGIKADCGGDPEHALRIESEIANKAKYRSLSHLATPPGHPSQIPDGDVAIAVLGERDQFVATTDRGSQSPPARSLRRRHVHHRLGGRRSLRQQQRQPCQPQRAETPTTASSVCDISGLCQSRHAERFRKLRAGRNPGPDAGKARPSPNRPVEVNHGPQAGESDRPLDAARSVAKNRSG